MSNFISKVTKRNLTPLKQVKLKLVHIDFWSATKAGFLVSLAIGIATIVGFAFVWLVLSTTGLFSQLNSLINSAGSTGADVGSALSLPRMLSFAGTLAIVDVVLGTVLAGISSLIFNIIARITGGVRIGFTNEQ
jgi:hypothetical protein